MTNTPSNHLSPNESLSLPGTMEGKGRNRNRVVRKRLAFLAAIFLAPLIFAQGVPDVTAQGVPDVTAIDPSSGKVNDTLTITGQNLGKDSVSSVFLSDDKDDYKADIVEQTDEQIVVKVPQVKPGIYNIAIQEGNKIFIKPVRFTVQE